VTDEFGSPTAVRVDALTEVTFASTPAGSAVLPVLEVTAPLPDTTFDAVGAAIEEAATLVITRAVIATSTRPTGKSDHKTRCWLRIR
jgi:hypothetical protein